MFDDIRVVFENLTGFRDFSGISCSQFMKMILADSERFLVKDILQKYDYEIMF